MGNTTEHDDENVSMAGTGIEFVGETDLMMLVNKNTQQALLSRTSGINQLAMNYEELVSLRLWITKALALLGN